MKRRIFLSVVLLCLSALAALSEEIPLEKARQIAESFFGSGQMTRSSSGCALRMIWDGGSPEVKSGDEAPAFYVFDNADGPGFVIVAGDDAAKPILGYSFDSEFVVENMPSNIKGWMDGIVQSVAMARENPSAYSTSAASTGEVVLKLETAKWNQDAPYNNLCPMDGNNRSVTGCVATSVAICLRYHKWPDAGTGTIPSYVTDTKNIIVPSITLGYEYDWDNMLMEYPRSSYSQEQAHAVARLMADCGAMLEMDYTAEASGTWSEQIPVALHKYMKYDASAGAYTRGVYSDDEWHSMLQKELKENGPVMYSGSAPDAGHAFVLDGYTTEDYYSLNWGWGGYCDGYFTLDMLNPADQGIGGATGAFSRYQSAILNVMKERGGQPEVRGTVLAYNNVNGLEADRDSFAPGVPFKLSAGFLSNASSAYYTGYIGFAVADRDMEVKELLLYYTVQDLPSNYGYHLTDIELVINSELEVGDQLIAVIWDEANYKWQQMRGDKSEGVVDAIPLYDELTIEESTSFEYSTLTKCINLKMKSDVNVKLKHPSGNIVNMETAVGTDDISIDTGSLKSGRYCLILSKGKEYKELYFVVDNER